MKYTAIVSLDLGQAADYSALSLFFMPLWVSAERAFRDALPEGGWVSPALLAPSQVEPLIADQRGRVSPFIEVRDVRRWALGTKYPVIVADVQRLMRSLPQPERAALVIDQTGVGRGVFDMFEEAGMSPIGITITGGSQVAYDGPSINVPKVDVIGAAQKLLQTQRLRFASQASGLAQLREELQNFRMKVNIRTGNTSMEAWRERDHDDQILSLSLGCWYILHCEAHLSWSAHDMRALSARRAV